MHHYLHKLARYDAWANERTLAAARALGRRDERVETLLGHLVHAKRLWLGRIDRSPEAPLPRTPPLTLELEEAARLLKLADARLLEVTGALVAAGPGHLVYYRTSKGDSHQTPLVDVIVHMVNHATYHRGQIATAVRNAGGTPAVTDYIAWVRELTGPA